MATNVIAIDPVYRVDEQDTASEAITPGHLIEIDTGQWRKHATAGDPIARVFALERDELGKEISVAYAINDEVKAGYFHQGQRVNALIASGQNLLQAAPLESAGNGTLRALASGTHIATSAESSGGTVLVETRHKIIVV